MAGYYNHQQAPPPSGYGNSFSPPFPPAQQSPPYNVNAYSAPTAYDAHQQHHPQYSPTQAMYGHEPTTPVLDQNQMNWFFNEVRSGNIPTIPPAQSQPQLQQTFAPPPPPPVPQLQPPPQALYAHQQQYQYPTQYAPQTRNEPQQLQGPFQPQQQSNPQYNVGQDVAMEDVYKDDGDWSDEEDEEYAPPDINTNNGNVNGTGEALPGLGPNAQGKRPAQSSEAQQPPPPFNPFRSQSLHNPPALPAQPPAPPQPAPKPVPTKQQQPPQPNLVLRDKAGEAVKDFHVRGIGFSQLAQEPSFDEFDKTVLKQLYSQYNVPQEAAPVPVEAPIPQAFNGSGGERLSEMKRLLASAGFEVDDAILATLTNAKSLPVVPSAIVPQEEAPAATLPGLGATPPHQQQQDARPAPPTRPISTSIPGADASEGRNAYLAKLKAMKGKSATSQQSTPVQGGAQSSLPGLGASTPRRAMINQEALKRKLLEKREALARAAAAGITERPAAPAHTESMSDIAYESGQVSAQSGSDATNTPVMDMSSPEEGEELEDGEEMEGPDLGEITESLVQQPTSTALQPTAPIAGLPPKPPEPSTVPSHVRNDSDQSARASPRAGLPPRPPAARQPYPYPPAVHSPSQYGRPWQPDLKRPASSAFGSPWNPQAKRQYPPQQGIDDAPEPVVIDISSEEEDGEDGEMMSEGEGEDAQPQQAPRTPWKSMQQHPSGASSAAFAPTPPVEVATPDPVVAARQEEHAKQKALIEAKRDALKRQIQLKEARKSQVASGNMSPSTANIGATMSSPVAASKSALSALRSSSVASRSSSVSVARQAALKSLEADIRTDEEQMEALQAQMERLRQEVARKNREKQALAEEIKSFGVDPEGMSHQQMREVRDTLAEEAEAEAQQAMADDEDIEDEEEEGEVDESSEEDDNGMETNQKTPLERIQANNPSDIPEANDPRALASGARVKIHNVSFSADKLAVRHLLRDYDITGISLPEHTRRNRVNRKKSGGNAYVDFLYPAEVEDAMRELKGRTFAGLSISVSYVEPVKPKGELLAQAHSLPPPKIIGKPSTSKGKQPKTSEKTQDPTEYLPQQVIISNLAERICNPKSFQGWAGRFVKSASNIEFPKDESTGAPLGKVYLELPDLRTAQKFVEVTMSRTNKKNPYQVEIVKERPKKHQEPLALGFMQALTGASIPGQLGGNAVDETVGDQEESSGSESDDEEEDEDEGGDEDEDEDAMSVSEDGSEEGELAEADEVEAPPAVGHQSAAAVEESDDAEEESDEMDVSEAGSDDSESEEDNQDDTRDAGVSLRDVQNAQPMDEDAADESEEEEGSDGQEPSDDEEGESEDEEVIEETLPLGGEDEESEEESDEDAEGEVDEVPEGAVATQEASREEAREVSHAPAQVIEHQAPVSTEAIAHQDYMPLETMEQNASEDDDAEGSVDGEVEDDVQGEGMTGVEETAVQQSSLAAPAQQPVANTSSSEQAFHSAPVDVEMLEDTELLDNYDDEDFYELDHAVAAAQVAEPQETLAPEDNDDDFYEPNKDDAPAVIEPCGPESGEEDEYDPDFDAAFEEAFAELDGDYVQSAGGNLITDHVQPQLEKKLGEVGEGNEKADGEEEEAQPEPTSGGGGLPGNGMLNGDAELSEDGEILSESDGGGEAEAEAAAAAIDHAVSSPSFAVPAPAHADDHIDQPPHQHYYPGRSTSPRIKFPIPKMRALGTQGQSTDVSRVSEGTTTTNKAPDTFKPYESALKSLKAYRYHPSYNADVKGGIRSLSYSHKLDPGQPLCPTELEGGTCRDPTQCAGQHLKDAAFSDSDIVRLIGSIDPSRPQEEKNRWSAGVKQVISEIQGKNITDLERIAEKVVAYRHAFFGNSILGLDAPTTTVEDIARHSDDEMSYEEGQEEDEW